MAIMMQIGGFNFTSVAWLEHMLLGRQARRGLGLDWIGLGPWGASFFFLR